MFRAIHAHNLKKSYLLMFAAISLMLLPINLLIQDTSLGSAFTYNIWQILLMASNFHITFTFMYIFRNRKTLVTRNNYKKYLIYPMVCLGLVLVVAFKWSVAWLYWEVFLSAYLLYHFYRQNVGVYEKLSQKPLKDLSLVVILHIALFLVIFRVHRLYFRDIVLEQGGFSSFLMQNSIYIGAFLFVLYLLRIFLINLEKMEKIFLLSVYIFFLPGLIFHSIDKALMSFAVVHAVQYAIITLKGHGRDWIVNMLLCSILWAVILTLRNSDFRAVKYLGLSFVALHFWYDSFIWKAVK